MRHQANIEVINDTLGDGDLSGLVVLASFKHVGLQLVASGVDAVARLKVGVSNDGTNYDFDILSGDVAQLDGFTGDFQGFLMLPNVFAAYLQVLVEEGACTDGSVKVTVTLKE